MTIGIDPVAAIVGGSGPDNWGGEEDQHSGGRWQPEGLDWAGLS